MQGCYDTCDLKKKVSSGDGYGALVSTDVAVMSNVRCRKTRLTGTDEQMPQGIGGADVWRFSLNTVASIPRLDGDDKILYVIVHEGITYDVIWFEPRKDHAGRLDHYEFRAEMR